MWRISLAHTQMVPFYKNTDTQIRCGQSLYSFFLKKTDLSFDQFEISFGAKSGWDVAGNENRHTSLLCKESFVGLYRKI